MGWCRVFGLDEVWKGRNRDQSPEAIHSQGSLNAAVLFYLSKTAVEIYFERSTIQPKVASASWGRIGGMAISDAVACSENGARLYGPRGMFEQNIRVQSKAPTLVAKSVMREIKYDMVFYYKESTIRIPG